VGKFIRGGSSAGDTGGADSVTLTTDNMPQHAHALNPGGGSQSVSVRGYSGQAGTSGYPMTTGATATPTSFNISIELSGNTGNAGEASPDAVDILPAYYTLCYIMKIS
jgi:microcystin-dependent protein